MNSAFPLPISTPSLPQPPDLVTNYQPGSHNLDVPSSQGHFLACLLPLFYFHMKREEEIGLLGRLMALARLD